MKTVDKLAMEDGTEALDMLVSMRAQPRPLEAVEIIEYEPQYQEVFKQLGLVPAQCG
jgi:hypothetical protein